jgi:RHS repeat-associated protein
MTANYDKIESSNNVRSYGSTEDQNKYVQLLCRFEPAEAVEDMTQIKGVAEGYGYATDEETEEEVYKYYLHIWNFTSSTWELLASHTGSSDQTISGSKTENLGNYVSGGYVYLLISTDVCQGAGYPAYIYADYAELEISYTDDYYGAELYIRNFNSSEWELLDSHENSSDTTIYGTRTSNISNYLDGSNYVMLLAYQKYETPAGKTGHIYTDYAECEITYTTSTQSTYTYDVDLKRIKKDVDGTVQKFIYDGANVVVEYDGNDSLLATYLTPGLDENLSMTRNSATYYYHSDALGSIRNITDSSEVAQNTYDYYAFGSVVGTPTENVTNDYRFTGRRWDSESGLYYYRTRFYNNQTGTFTQSDKYFVDLIIAQDEMQATAEQITKLLPLHSYVSNNPVNFADPEGAQNPCNCQDRCDAAVPGCRRQCTYWNPFKTIGCLYCCNKTAVQICYTICLARPYHQPGWEFNACHP